MILHRTLVLYEWLIFHKKLQSSKDWSFCFHFVNFFFTSVCCDGKIQGSGFVAGNQIQRLFL